MRDLTKDSISGHILTLSVPVAIGAAIQLAYHMVDLYFVAGIGVDAIAGLNAAGNVVLIFSALAQVIGIGTAALVSHAVGRRDRKDANDIFNQGLILSAICGIGVAVFIYAVMSSYLHSVAADIGTVEAGAAYLTWVLPGYALMLPMVVLGSALRGTGIVRPAVVFSMLTLALNAVLAPILISGWLTKIALGVKGAGLATSVSIAVGTIIFVWRFGRLQDYLSLRRIVSMQSTRQWRRILKIGLPAGGEFIIAFSYMALVYYMIRNFGASAQAGFGIGMRLAQTLLVPAIAIGVALAPIAGQNYGAMNSERVKETFTKATAVGIGLMILGTSITQWQAPAMVAIFNVDASTTAVATSFITAFSWVFVAQCLSITCSSMFQALGNVVPSLISSCAQLVTFYGLSVWLSSRPHFNLDALWYATIASVSLQAALSALMLRGELKRKLAGTVISDACSAGLLENASRIDK